jgi:3-hydroxyacyl-[acyl-carrier-protein] dehydratase
MGTKDPKGNNPPITELLPIRYPFLMVDRLLERGPGRVVAVKNVSYDEWFFAGHFPDRPIMPGTLLMEGMAQTAGLLLAEGSKRAGGLLVGIDQARFRRQVVPGDQVVYEAKLLRARRGLYRVEAEARVEGELVAEAIISLMSDSEGEPADE